MKSFRVLRTASPVIRNPPVAFRAVFLNDLEAAIILEEREAVSLSNWKVAFSASSTTITALPAWIL
jgi:hypothetical protein